MDKYAHVHGVWSKAGTGGFESYCLSRIARLSVFNGSSYCVVFSLVQIVLIYACQCMLHALLDVLQSS